MAYIPSKVKTGLTKARMGFAKINTAISKWQRIRKKVVMVVKAKDAILIGVLIILSKLVNNFIASIVFALLAIFATVTILEYRGYRKPLERFTLLCGPLGIIYFAVKLWLGNFASAFVVYIGFPLIIIIFVWWQSKTNASRARPNGWVLSCRTPNFQNIQNETSSC